MDKREIIFKSYQKPSNELNTKAKYILVKEDKIVSKADTKKDLLKAVDIEIDKRGNLYINGKQNFISYGLKGEGGEEEGSEDDKFALEELVDYLYNGRLETTLRSRNIYIYKIENYE